MGSEGCRRPEAELPVQGVVEDLDRSLGVVASVQPRPDALRESVEGVEPGPRVDGSVEGGDQQRTGGEVDVRFRPSDQPSEPRPDRLARSGLACATFGPGSVEHVGHPTRPVRAGRGTARAGSGSARCTIGVPVRTASHVMPIVSEERDPSASGVRAGLRELRPVPAGMPDADRRPPVEAEVGDPFAVLRVLELVARIERGAAVRLDDLVDRLNASWLDWLFTRAVVVDALITLQANWMADYRNASGIVLDDGLLGPTVTVEDSTRVDPWIVRQAIRANEACDEALRVFARRGHPMDEG